MLKIIYNHISKVQLCSHPNGLFVIGLYFYQYIGYDMARMRANKSRANGYFIPRGVAKCPLTNIMFFGINIRYHLRYFTYRYRVTGT